MAITKKPRKKTTRKEGVKADGTLKKGYRYVKGGRVVKAKAKSSLSKPKTASKRRRSVSAKKVCRTILNTPGINKRTGQLLKGWKYENGVPVKVKKPTKKRKTLRVLPKAGLGATTPATAKMKNPKIGQFVWDKHDKCKKKVQSVPKNGNELYFIGKDREPVRRSEFIFPLPKK